MSEQRRIYKYQGTLIGDDRVDDLIAQVDNKVSTDEFEKLVKVTPTDIAVKDNNKIILKHDSEEISGQTNPVEFKTINNQSLLGAGNINIDAGSAVILEAGMTVTTELVEKLKKASQIFYRFTSEFEDKTTYTLPCEIELDSDNHLVLTIIWNSATTGVTLLGTSINFNAKFTDKLSIGSDNISKLLLFYVNENNVYINSDYNIKVLSSVQIVDYTTAFTGLDLEIILSADTVFAQTANDEDGAVILKYRAIYSSLGFGKITRIILVGDPVDYAFDNFTYLIVEEGKTANEIMQNVKFSDFVHESQLKTINNELLVGSGGGNIDIPTVQIEILEEGDN